MVQSIVLTSQLSSLSDFKHMNSGIYAGQFDIRVKYYAADLLLHRIT